MNGPRLRQQQTLRGRFRLIRWPNFLAQPVEVVSISV